MLNLFLAYLAGIATLLNPCVLPLLPIVAASAMQDSRAGPLYLAAGLAVASTGVGFALATLGSVLGLTAQTMTQFGAVLLVAFGTIMLLPARLSPFGALAGVAGRAQGVSMRLSGSSAANFGAGAALGLAWSPCIGPTMGAAIALASTGQSLGTSFAIMAAFGAGIATKIVGLAYGGRAVIARRKGALAALAPKALRIFALTSITMGVVLLTKAYIPLERWLVAQMPDWLLNLSTSI